MSVYLFTKLFYLLLFLLMCGTLCGHVCVNGEAPKIPNAGKTIDLFKKAEDLKSALKPEGKSQTSDIKLSLKDYYSPVILTTNKFFVALTGVNRMSATGKSVTVLTKYIDTKSDENWRDSMFNPSNGKWNTQFAAYDSSENNEESTSVVRGLVAAAKGDKIYLFLINASSTIEDVATQSGSSIDFRLAVGTVDTSDGGKLTWSIKGPFISEAKKFTEHLKGKKLSNSAFSGSTIILQEKVIFFLKTQTVDKKTVFAFFNLEDKESAEALQFLSSDEVSKGCYPYFFLWEKKIIMLSTNCESVSDQIVKETTEFTTMKKWPDSSGPFSSFVEFFNDKSDFTTANVKGTNNVLLFTQKKTKPQQSSGNHEVYLWVTDGNHSYRAKDALTDVSATPISLFYTNNELLAFYQKWGETSDPKNIVFRQLKTQLDDITFVIAAWNNNKETVKKLCNDKILCDIELSTDTLVGFLSNNSKSGKWKDEYYYVNATVNNSAKKIDNGFTFSGTGVGAKWEVGKKQEEQPYNFTETGFTLLATVEIGKNNNEKTFDNSLLGLVLEGNKRIGLLCSGGNWAVGDKTEILIKSAEKCQQEESYIVGLVLRKNENLAIFVDGKKLSDLDVEALNIGEWKNITHFYFGADAEEAGGTQKLAKTDVTITNVLLYNRPFDEDKIKNIKAQKREKPETPTPPLNGTINTQEDGRSTGENGRPSSTSATEKDGAEIKLCLFSMNSVALLCILFGVLGRYVY